MAKTLEKMSREELKQRVKELDRERKAAEKALATLADREKKAALEAAEKVAKEHGFSLADLTGDAPKRKRRASSGSSGEPKFRNPDTGQTWTGKGRPPAWISEADAAGRPRSDFAV